MCLPHYSSPHLFLYVCLSERCQQEIDRVLEKKDHVCYDDRHNMPYVQVYRSETWLCVTYWAEYGTKQ